MKARTLAKLMPGCLIAMLTLVAAVPQLSEQVETGHLIMPDGHQIDYRIRLLPLASFPGIPEAIRAQLKGRRCMVPQTYEARAPENVIHGAFERRGSSDWAVLCSSGGATSLLVFFADHQSAPFTLAGGKDTQWIAGAHGFAWGIDAIGPTETALDLHAAPGSYDHDAVRGEFIGTSSTIHYFQNGRWASFSPDD